MLADRSGSAESIETREEMEALRQLGIQLGQGFLLGKPTPDLVA